LLLAALIAMGFIGSRVVSDVAELTPSRRAIPEADLAGTAAEGLPADSNAVERPPLGRLQKSNLGVLLLFSQMLQVQVVSIIVVGFLVAVGVLVAPEHVQIEWVGGPVHPILEFWLLDELRLLSWEMVVVAVMLGSFAGVYFAGYALGDERYRAEALGHTLSDLRRAIAVRDAYALWLKRRERAVPIESTEPVPVPNSA
jgi:hypothetical protein